MKHLIRKSVFETNSSSSHSISLATEDKEFVLDTIYPDQDGRIFLTGGEFGWEWFKHNDALTKANYAAQDSINMELLVEVIKEQTGATEVIIMDTSNGYIDHDSVGTTPGSDKESLRNFIFNKNSWLFGGNDNESPDPVFYDVPEIRNGKIIVPKYKYELKVDGLLKTTKFKEYPTTHELSTGFEALFRHTLLTDSGDFIENEGVMWQITRQRNFFEVSWQVEQDYSTGEIIFTKENINTYAMEEALEIQGTPDTKLNWDEKRKALTQHILTFPALYKKVKFTLEEL